MPDWDTRHPPNEDGTVDIVEKECAKCGMLIPDVGIYTEQHNYRVHGIGAIEEPPPFDPDLDLITDVGPDA